MYSTCRVCKRVLNDRTDTRYEMGVHGDILCSPECVVEWRAEVGAW